MFHFSYKLASVALLKFLPFIEFEVPFQTVCQHPFHLEGVLRRQQASNNTEAAADLNPLTDG